MKNILITGAGGNLGKAAVAKFLKEGYRVHATVSPGRNEEFGNENVVTYSVDLSDEQSSKQLISKIVDQYKTLDAVLLLVGGYAPGTIADTTSGLVSKMFTLNFFTAYHIVQPVFHRMAGQPAGGKIVLVGARPALVANDGKKNLAYALSKSLLFKLAEFLNAEGKDKGVVTSVIVPSTVDTPENRKAMPDADFTKWVTPGEIAEAIFFLTSEKGNALRDPVLKLYNKA